LSLSRRGAIVQIGAYPFGWLLQGFALALYAMAGYFQ